MTRKELSGKAPSQRSGASSACSTESPFVRYFCHLTPQGNALGDLGHRYFVALKRLEVPLRVIPCSGAFYGAGRWAACEEDFTRPVPDVYVNVVCGAESDLARLHTSGVTNVAVVERGRSTDLPYEVIDSEERLERFLTELRRMS